MRCSITGGGCLCPQCWDMNMARPELRRMLILLAGLACGSLSAAAVKSLDFMP